MEFDILTFECGIPYKIPFENLKICLLKIKEMYKTDYDYLITSKRETVFFFFN
jgi:hypothetical protein